MVKSLSHSAKSKAPLNSGGGVVILITLLRDHSPLPGGTPHWEPGWGRSALQRFIIKVIS